MKRLRLSVAENELKLSMTLPVPLDRAWKELIQWEKQSNWMLATKVWVTSESREGVGTEIAAFTGLAPHRYPMMKFFGVLDLMRVVEWRVGSESARCDVIHYGKIIKGTGTFLLTRSSDSSVRFDWSEIVVAPRALFYLLKPFTLVGVYLSLSRFARSLSAQR